MGNGMNKIVEGLYVGNIRDAQDRKRLDSNNITHILSIHDMAKKLHDDKEYLCIKASDNAAQDLSQFFRQCNEFIHAARLSGGSVLVHCLAGVSRSVTVTVAYLMTVTNLGWRDTLKAVRGARQCANPNFGFQRQLGNYEEEQLEQERKWLKSQFPENPFQDEAACRRLMEAHWQFVLHGNNAETEESNTYTLPYNAYGNREPKNRTDSEGGTKSDSEANKRTVSKRLETTEQSSCTWQNDRSHGPVANSKETQIFRSEVKHDISGKD
ncbi:dual specificity protein phosphatase 22-B-like [Lingula anatina]|uniref:Dual specificity protein phosphatase 15 n=1 Tax=Lingula anatina TaxID=7574 RepID=A0A1S3H255_LINAN|nr:dual specificity protein phosphatase 22-B-like [Lingula anatina]|eukprot:XP_013380210.1 dual specificity protein phosphatase 22-B-like [Lingula anatina]